MLSPIERACKRSLDVVVSLLALAATGWIIGLAVLWARLDTKQSGIFRQRRIGMHGRCFYIYKIRTMRLVPGFDTNVTTQNDPRITKVGKILRRWKIDELPQFWNVLKGDMSLVGPRPDVPEYIERLRREAPRVLTVRPGITGPASIKYRREERLLESQLDSEAFNDLILFPDKMKINEAYVTHYSFAKDLVYLLQTLYSGGAATQGPGSSTFHEHQTA
jgi:lipopolysaccharide/colanic/teichoic acid biosynthesis glycosyltransferase